MPARQNEAKRGRSGRTDEPYTSTTSPPRRNRGTDETPSGDTPCFTSVRGRAKMLGIYFCSRRADFEKVIEMPIRWFQLLVLLLAEAHASRRDAQVRFLKLQVELLREHIPGERVILAPEERTA